MRSRNLFSGFFFANSILKILKKFAVSKIILYLHSKITFNQLIKQRSNVQIYTAFSSRITTFSGAASWYGSFIINYYFEIYKPEVLRFRVFLCTKF